VTGQVARHDEQGVDADIIALARIAVSQSLGGNRDTPQPIFIECPGGGIGGAPLLDFDERQHSPAPSDQVNLAAGYPRPLSQYPPAVQPQPPGGDGLGLAAARLGKLPVQSLPPSSNARA
jgi:hypothetical protein